MFRQSVLPMALAGIIVFAQRLDACSICFGASDEPVTKAISWAIIFLLGVVGGVLGGIVAFMVYLRRRSSACQEKNAFEQNLLKIDLSNTEVFPKNRINSSLLVEKNSRSLLPKQTNRFDSSGTHYAQ